MPRQGFRKQHCNQITRHAETVERQGNMRKLGAPFQVEHKNFFERNDWFRLYICIQLHLCFCISCFRFTRVSYSRWLRRN